MRQAIYRWETSAALELLQSALVIRLASSLEDGTPVYRTLNAVVVDGAVAFHGASAGEKSGLIGRQAVVAADEVIATIPSYWLDAERASAASCYYRSVQAHGTLERIEDPQQKARALNALMAKYQPEGGYAPLDPQEAAGAKELARVSVWRMPLERIEGKAKLGQNRKPAELERILEGLWHRGAAGDLAAIALILEANPKQPTPEFLQAPAGCTLVPALGLEEAQEVGSWLQHAYWNAEYDAGALAAIHLGSDAWVGVRNAHGELVATARALSDGVKDAWIYDVMVLPEWQGQGIGTAVVRFLLDHPALRQARQVTLKTLDAQELYQRLGFEETRPEPPRSQMRLERFPFPGYN